MLLSLRGEFDKIPLKGKIASYTIYKVPIYSLKRPDHSVKKVIFDKQGRIISSVEYDNYDFRSGKSEVNVYTANKVINYKCFCSDIQDFVEKFIIRDKNSFKNTPSYATANEPTKFVKISTFDKNKNIVNISSYSERGYKTDEVKSIFTADKLVHFEKLNFDDIIVYTEKITYNKSGSIIEKIETDKNRGEGKNVNSYDKVGNLLESKSYVNNKLTDDFTYIVKIKDNYKEYVTHDEIAGIDRITKKIFYNSNGLETQLLKYNYKGAISMNIDYTYSSQSILESESTYYTKDILSSKLQYKTDKQGNWIELKEFKPVIAIENNVKTPHLEVTKYIRKIEYSK